MKQTTATHSTLTVKDKEIDRLHRELKVFREGVEKAKLKSNFHSMIPDVNKKSDSAKNTNTDFKALWNKQMPENKTHSIQQNEPNNNPAINKTNTGWTTFEDTFNVSGEKSTLKRSKVEQ
jgi:hypothetical protein